MIWVYARVSADECEYSCCGEIRRVRFGVATLCRICGQRIDTSAPPERLVQQRKDIFAYLAYEKMSGDFREQPEVISSAKVKFADRPFGAIIMKEMRPGDAVVATKLDRIFRNSRDLHNTVHVFEERGVSLHLVNQKVDTSTAIGRLFLGITGLYAEFEADQQSERRLTSINHRKNDGIAVGPAPFGMKVSPQLENGKIVKRLVVNEDEIRLLVDILAWKRKRVSVLATREKLFVSGIVNRRGNPYSKKGVERLRKLAEQFQADGLLR